MQATEAIVPRAHTRLRRLDLRVAVGLVLKLVAVLGGASLIRSAQQRTPVLLVAGTVQPGEVIEEADLRVAEVSLPAGVDYLPPRCGIRSWAGWPPSRCGKARS